jgi:orotidine-5'-phosphate decarboxylase
MNASITARVIVALDFSNAVQATEFVDRLTPGSCRLKIGKELFTSEGPALVRRFVEQGHDVFLDLKYHDIPHTVAKACEAAAALGVWMVNVHACGGSRMMLAAREALENAGGRRPLLIAVTVLTSMGRRDLAELGLDIEPEAQVLRLATLTQSAGLDGVVCAPQEAAALRKQTGDAFILVTPGVRPAGTSADDQTRVLTPVAAIRQGANYLVMGRPITQAIDPVAALNAVYRELNALSIL